MIPRKKQEQMAHLLVTFVLLISMAMTTSGSIDFVRQKIGTTLLRSNGHFNSLPSIIHSRRTRSFITSDFRTQEPKPKINNVKENTKVGYSLPCDGKKSNGEQLNLAISNEGAEVKKIKIVSRKKISIQHLSFWENMLCGAISRSFAQTVMHPANTMKTILQTRTLGGEAAMTFSQLCKPTSMKLLTRGAGAQFVLSVPHGAVNFAVLEFVRRQLGTIFENRGGKINDKSIGPGLDFLSSALATFGCSIVSTPQMVIVDNIMAGTYPNLKTAVVALSAEKGGINGFYKGWGPGLIGKIPGYGLTWVFFQELKRIQLKVMEREPKNIENSIMGCIASAASVSIMIPIDTIKTRLVTQVAAPGIVPYKGIIDCAFRVSREEGINAFYRGLPPRLISVVPMIGIQFGVYEFAKKFMLDRHMSASADNIEKNFR